MLAHEWRELEMLCDRIGDLRERLVVACKTGNSGLAEGLTAELDRALHQRERLVRYISTQLGSVAADRVSDGDAAPRRTPTEQGERPVAIPH